MENLSEKEILIRLAEGNKLAYGFVFKIYYERLFRFSLHYLNDNEAAKDVIQDVFASMLEDSKKFAQVKNLSSWLYTLTKNLSLKKIDQLKVRQKHADTLKYRQLSHSLDALNELDTSPITFNEISKIISDTLEQLPDQTRKIFELSRFENKKNREIAEELNISIKTVEANITKTLKHLKKALKHYLPLVFFMV